MKNLPANAGDMIPGAGRPPWRKQWQFTAVFLPGKSHGQRNRQAIVHGVAKESDTTERLNNDNCKTDRTCKHLICAWHAEVLKKYFLYSMLGTRPNFLKIDLMYPNLFPTFKSFYRSMEATTWRNRWDKVTVMPLSMSPSQITPWY